MIKYSIEDIKFKRASFIIAFICMIAIPIVNNLVLSPVYTYILGDIEWINTTNVLSVVINFLNTISLYLGFGVLIYNTYKYSIKKSIPLIVMNIISIFLFYTSSIIVNQVFSKLDQSQLLYILLYSLVNLFFDIVKLVIVLFLCKTVKKKYSKRGTSDITINNAILSKTNPLLVTMFWVVITLTIIRLIQSLSETFMMFYQYGLPINSTELVYIITPYITLIINAIIGYFLMLFISLILEKLYTKSTGLSLNL